MEREKKNVEMVGGKSKGEEEEEGEGGEGRGGARGENSEFASHPRRLSMANIWGQPVGFRKTSASAPWSDTAIGDEVLTPARTQATPDANTDTCSERERERMKSEGGERERDRGENPFFSYACRCPLPSPSLNISAPMTRSLPCGTPLVAHARPGFIWRWWDEQQPCYFL